MDETTRIRNETGEPVTVVEFASAQDLRRSCREQLRDAGLPLDEINAVMRHRDIQTTMRHAEMASKMKRATDEVYVPIVQLNKQKA